MHVLTTEWFWFLLCLTATPYWLSTCWTCATVWGTGSLIQFEALLSDYPHKLMANDCSSLLLDSSLVNTHFLLFPVWEKTTHHAQRIKAGPERENWAMEFKHGEVQFISSIWFIYVTTPDDSWNTWYLNIYQTFPEYLSFSNNTLVNYFSWIFPSLLYLIK